MLGYEDIPRELNVASHFLDANVRAGHAERVALVTDTPGEAPTETTYAELIALSNRIGHVLRRHGVRSEERVILALADGPLFVAAWFAALKIGAVVAEVYTFLQPKDYAYYLNYSKAGVVITDAETAPRLREARAECAYLRMLLIAGEPELAAGEAALEREIADVPDELELAPTSKDSIGLWKFTTGSTGAPKAAVHCHHDPLISHELYARGVLGLSANDSVLPVPKLFFGYARDLTALFPFGVGGRGIVFPDRSTPERLFELIERHRPTVLVQVPTMMAAMVAHERAESADLSSLRLVVSSGETLPEPLHRRWLELFDAEVIEGVGSSELYHIYVSNRPGEVRLGSAGRAVPGYELTLLDADGAPVAEGEPGELEVRGESAALLYWDEHERSKETFAGDRVRTGDLFAADGDGFLFYRGRADSLLKVGGIWVAPLEIEACLLEHPQVSECAVVGRSQDGLAVPAAVVVAMPGASPTPEELVEHVRSQLAPHKAPRIVELVDTLPRTANGKVDRTALEAGPGSPATAATTETEAAR